MIKSKKEYMEYIKTDNQWLIPETHKEKIIESIASYPSHILRKYLRYLILILQMEISGKGCLLFIMKERKIDLEADLELR